MEEIKVIETKICKTCGIERNLNFFHKQIIKRNNKTYYNSKCRICEPNSRARKTHKIVTKICLNCLKQKELKDYDQLINKNGLKSYFSICSDCRLVLLKTKNERERQTSAIYRLNNKEKRKEYNKKYDAEHKEEKRKYTKDYSKKRQETDLEYKLRRRLSKSIGNILKSNGGSKQNKSISEFLPYTVKEFKQHIESLFEPWMNWNNQGRYIKNTWKNDDQSTWVWNLDHIIPQTKLPFKSMEEDNFKKCWSLENLRPYSAKQNMIDGNRR